jgi:polyhydroxyalkanoate synthesis regulator phasin
MDQEKRREQFGTRLRRAWCAVVRTAEAMERTPFDELFDRVDRLEREVAALKSRHGQKVVETT